MPLPFQTRGSRLIVVDENGKAIGYIVTHGTSRVFVRDVFIGSYIDLQAATLALEQALTPIEPDPESILGFVVPTDGTTIVDSTGAEWTIESGTNNVLRNGQLFNGGWAQQLLYYTYPASTGLPGKTVWHKGVGNGLWMFWDTRTSEHVWTAIVGDPRNPPVSAAWFTVPEDGSSLVDISGNTWALGTQFGSGFDVLKNGVPYGGAWASKIKLDDDLTTIWHENPSGLGWIKEDPDHIPAFWESPTSDPEGGDPQPEGDGVTTGTINALTLNKITVQDTTSWSDALILANLAYIIVETGKEPGLGAPGTKGVGGHWPSVVYANSSERNAVSSSNFIHVGQLDSGDVYAWADGGWQNRAQGAIDSSQGVLRKIMPHAFVAKIISVNRGSGELTLDREAQMAVTNANCYLDGTPIIQNAFNNLSSGSNPADPGQSSSGGDTIDGPWDWDTITLSTINLNTLFPGYTSVAMGGPVVVNNKNYIKLTQNSTTSFQLYAPRGAPGAHIEFGSCRGVLVENVQIRGNHRNDNGYCLQWGGSGSVTPNFGYLSDHIDASQDGATSGISFIISYGCELRSSTVTDTFIGANSYQCDNIMFRDVFHFRTDPPLVYQWFLLHSSGTGGWFVDCGSQSNHIHGGMELFQQSGGGNVRPDCKNGWLSANDCGSGYMIGVDQANPSAGGGTLRATLNALVGTEAYFPVFIGWFSPMVDINTSQAQTKSTIGGSYPSGYKGIVQGLQMVVEDYTANGSDTPIGIKVRDNNADIRIIGNVYQGKNYVVGGRVGGSVGIQANGRNCLIQGNTITGSSQQAGTSLNIWANHGIDGGGNVVNSPGEKEIFNLG